MVNGEGQATMEIVGTQGDLRPSAMRTETVVAQYRMGHEISRPKPSGVL